MNTQTVHYGLLCLRALDACHPKALTPRFLSEQEGIPLDPCRDILERLQAAGMIENLGKETYRLIQPLAELTALEVLQALSAPAVKPTAFKVLFGASRGMALRPTLQAAGRLAGPLVVAEG